MSDEQQEQQAPAAGGSRLPIKTLAIIAFMLVGEAAVIIGAMMVLGGPSEIHAEHIVGEESAISSDTVEVTILHEKLTNASTGRTFLYDTEIMAIVAVENEPRVRELLDARLGKIRTGVASIFGAAEASYFKEPARDTLTRQSLEYLREVFGKTPDDKDLVEAVLIPKLMGFPADF